MSWLEEKVKLGRSDLRVGRLGLGASYGAPTSAYEAAFDAGCTYFYWGAIRGRRMAQAIRNITARGLRDQVAVVIQDFRRSGVGLEKSLRRGLKSLGLDYADVLLLGWYNRPPGERILEAAEALRKQGAIRYLGISGHQRPIFPGLAEDPRYDLFQLRYNAANRGADQDMFPHLPEARPGIVAFTATRRMSLANSRRIPDRERKPTAGDCYRFVLTNPVVDVVISAPSNGEQMTQNLREIAQGPLSPEELTWMRRIGDYVYGRVRDF
jgi:aryl-alcohol dehydrogenase-like predicted oxidoreductase